MTSTLNQFTPGLYTFVVLAFFLTTLAVWSDEHTYQKTVISALQNINVGDWEISSEDLKITGTSEPWSIKKYRLHGGLQEGVEIIELYNGQITARMIPTRGMNILDITAGDIRLGWDSPIKEVVHPKYAEQEHNNGLGWLYGFNEWMMRCGLEYAGHPGEDNGRLLTLHGRIANIPASEVTVIVDKTPPYRIQVVGEVNERWFKGAQFVLKTVFSTEIGSKTFRLDDTIKNEASNEKEFMMIYHANFGPPLLENGAQFMGTIAEVSPFNQSAVSGLNKWNQYGPPARVWADEMVFCVFARADENGIAHFMLQNAAQNKGVAFNYPLAQLPYLNLWKNPDSLANGYVTGLEPATGFAHNRSWEREMGRVPKLKGGESYQFQIEYKFLDSQSEVESARQQIDRVNAGQPVTLTEEFETDPLRP